MRVPTPLTSMGIRTNDTLPPGHRLHWYQIQAILGEGGFGTTYLGRDNNLSQAVAIKEYFPRSYVSRLPDRRVRPRPGVNTRFYQWGLKRFLDEARLLARFRHPNIVRVLSVFETLGTAYMVMELERGRSFGRAITEGVLYSDACLMDVCLPLLNGLQLVHGAGFIHRDIKPNNILMRERLGPVLIDFGSARQPVPGDGRELTAIVSRGYAPFEQYDAGNEDAQGPWTDIYGMAATLYHAATGQLPTEALTRGMAMLNNDPDPLEPAVEAGADCFSRELLQAIDIGMAFRAEDRPQSVAQWLEHFPTHSAGRVAPDVRTEALRSPRTRWRSSPGMTWAVPPAPPRATCRSTRRDPPR
jgi:serine/threonine protein kinase